MWKDIVRVRIMSQQAWRLMWTIFPRVLISRSSDNQVETNGNDINWHYHKTVYLIFFPLKVKNVSWSSYISFMWQSSWNQLKRHFIDTITKQCIWFYSFGLDANSLEIYITQYKNCLNIVYQSLEGCRKLHCWALVFCYTQQRQINDMHSQGKENLIFMILDWIWEPMTRTKRVTYTIIFNIIMIGYLLLLLVNLGQP